MHAVPHGAEDSMGSCYPRFRLQWSHLHFGALLTLLWDMRLYLPSPHPSTHFGALLYHTVLLCTISDTELVTVTDLVAGRNVHKPSGAARALLFATITI